MEKKELYDSINKSIHANDAELFSYLIVKLGDELDNKLINYYFDCAASSNKVNIMEVLFKMGADVNHPRRSTAPEGPILSAASTLALDAIKWLLAHGAKINFDDKGKVKCSALTYVMKNGKIGLEAVKTLIEAGADYNSTWNNFTALDFAIRYNHRRIVEYMRSIGAKTYNELIGKHVPRPTDEEQIYWIMGEHVGKPEPLPLPPMKPIIPEIKFHVIRKKTYNVLITIGMSSHMMTVPDGEDSFEFAELMMRLPPNWPLDLESLKKPENIWPIELIRYVANYPFENNTWLHSEYTVLPNGNPPKPFFPNTRQCYTLVGIDFSDAGVLCMGDGRRLQFYNIYTIYPEEYEFLKTHKLYELTDIFEKRRLRNINLKRKSAIE